MSVYSRRFFSVLIVLVISLLYIFNSFASMSGSATPSYAIQVKDKQFDIATSSNAMPSDDFADSDDFDTLDVPVLMSDGLDVPDNTIDYTDSYMYLTYYNMSNTVRTVRVPLNSNGYASISLPSDFVRAHTLYLEFYNGSIPPSGKYDFSVYFGSNTGGFTYGQAFIASSKDINNANQQSSWNGGLDLTQSSGDMLISGSIDINSGLRRISIGAYVNGLIPPVGGYWKVSFTRLSSSAVVDNTTAGGTQTMDDIQGNIADNTAQQVAQGDTIIELIKNTIQTISSQLTAFWNQLAGEFTNLYGKMSQQHSEQLQADRENTDDIIAADDANTNKVTTAIESHGNFIIEGLKKLFIPSDEYFKAYFDDLYGWFSERFGFLSFPIDLLLEVIDIFANSSQTDCVLVLPSFTIMDNLLWPEMSFNLTEFLDTNFSFVVVAIKTVTSIYLVMAFVQLCEEKWNEVMMN